MTITDDDDPKVILSPRQVFNGQTAYGVELIGIGEEGEWIALGHIDPLRMLAAMRKAGRAERFSAGEVFGDGPWTVADHVALVKHTRALFTEHPEYAWWASWAADDQTHPAAVEVTVYNP